MSRLSKSAPALGALLLMSSVATAQRGTASKAVTPKPEDTEVWTPVPKIITPGRTNADPTSDAIILFDGKNANEWVSARDGSPAGWSVANGVMTVVKPAGDIKTKRSFTNYQLHIEWRIPEGITGSGQARGNSGVYLAAVDSGGYEIQV